MDTAVSTSSVPQPAICTASAGAEAQQHGSAKGVATEYRPDGDRQHPGRTVDLLPVTLTGAYWLGRGRGTVGGRKLQRNSDLPDDFCQHPSTLQLILQALEGLPLLERGKLCSFGERVFLTMLVRG